MKHEYTEVGLARMLGVSKRHINRLLAGCACEQRPANGGVQKVYTLGALPLAMQKRIIAEKLSIDESFIPDESAIDEESLRQLMARWEEAPEWNRRLVNEVREPIVMALQAFADGKGLPIRKAEEEFSRLFNERRAPGVSEAIYERMDSTSPETLGRLRRTYSKEGKAGLLTRYGGKKGRFFAVIPDMEIFISGQMQKNPSIKVARLHEMIQKLYPDCAPDRKTIADYVESVWRGKEASNKQIHTLIRDPRAWKNSFMPAFGDRGALATYFGQLWEMDSTPADVVTVDTGRCAICGLVDVYSRIVRVVVAPTSRATAISALMRKGIIDLGVPEIIRMDNGKDYQSELIDVICTSLRIKRPHLDPYAPEQKPFIERALGTLAHGVMEIFPGFIGHSVSERQEIRARDTWGKKIFEPGDPVKVPFTMRELQEAFNKSISLYENRPHRGLKGKTPIEMARESRRQPKKIRDERVLDILLAPISTRVVQKKGIQLDDVWYTAPELIEGEHIGRTVHLKRDLINAGLIYVFSSSNSGDFKFICKATNDALTGESLEEYLQAKRRGEKELKRKAKALQALSQTVQDPYTILIDEATVSTASEHENIIPFQADADLPAIREARKALEEPKEEIGLAQQLGQVVHMDESQASKASASNEWKPRYPSELLDNPIELYLWYEKERQKRQLEKEELEHMAYLKESFPAVQYWLELRDEKAALE